MYSYTAGFQNKKIILEAQSLYDAKLKAIEHFKPKKKDIGLLWVILNTEHDPAILD